jgi:hypothetical protein
MVSKFQSMVIQPCGFGHEVSRGSVVSAVQQERIWLKLEGHVHGSSSQEENAQKGHFQPRGREKNREREGKTPQLHSHLCPRERRPLSSFS